MTSIKVKDVAFGKKAGSERLLILLTLRRLRSGTMLRPSGPTGYIGVVRGLSWGLRVRQFPMSVQHVFYSLCVIRRQSISW